MKQRRPNIYCWYCEAHHLGEYDCALNIYVPSIRIGEGGVVKEQEVPYAKQQDK